jgi:hypothetical protein
MAGVAYGSANHPGCCIIATQQLVAAVPFASVSSSPAGDPVILAFIDRSGSGEWRWLATHRPPSSLATASPDHILRVYFTVKSESSYQNCCIAYHRLLRRADSIFIGTAAGTQISGLTGPLQGQRI